MDATVIRIRLSYYIVVVRSMVVCGTATRIYNEVCK